MEKIQLPGIQYTQQEKNRKRAHVRKEFISLSKNVTGGELNCLANSDLGLLFRLYDSTFLGGYFQSSQFQGSIAFTLSTRMRTNAGKLVYLKNVGSKDENQEYYEFKIGVKPQKIILMKGRVVDEKQKETSCRRDFDINYGCRNSCSICCFTVFDAGRGPSRVDRA